MRKDNSKLADFQLAAVVLGDLVQNRGNHLAGATPFGPVINQYRGVRLEHFVVEAAVSDVHNQIAHVFLQRDKKAEWQHHSTTRRDSERRWSGA